MFRKACPYVALLAFALVVRYNSGSALRGYPPGCNEVERAALSVANAGAIRDVYGDGSGPSAHCAPLYPWVLGQLYRFADATETPPRPYQEALALVLTCLGITLVPLLARRAGLAPGTGWLTALVLCLVPRSGGFYEASGSSEQPLLFLAVPLLLLVFIRLHELKWRSRVWVPVAAVLVGLSALLGPGLLAIPAGAILLDLVALRDDRRAVATGALIVVATTVLMLVPWAERNRRELGARVWTRSNFGLELWIGNSPGATGRTYSPEFWGKHPFCDATERAECARAGELAYMHQKKQLAREWIAANPDEFVRLTAARAVSFWFPDKALYGINGNRRIANLLGAFSAGMLAGVVCLFWTAHPYRWLFALTLLGLSLPYFVTHVEVRYRSPVNGLCVLLACDVVVRGALWALRTVLPRLPVLVPRTKLGAVKPG